MSIYCDHCNQGFSLHVAALIIMDAEKETSPMIIRSKGCAEWERNSHCCTIALFHVYGKGRQNHVAISIKVVQLHSSVNLCCTYFLLQIKTLAIILLSFHDELGYHIAVSLLIIIVQEVAQAGNGYDLDCRPGKLNL